MKKRPYNELDIQLLTERVERTMSAIDIAYFRASSSYSRLKDSLLNIVKSEYDSALRCISVEKLLGTQSNGFADLLNRAGLNDLYSVLNAGVLRLAEIPNISESEAEHIYQKATQLSEATYNGLEIPICTDYVTPEFTELISSIANYRYATISKNLAYKMYALLPDNPRIELSKLAPLRSTLAWKQSNKQLKLLALDSYQSLLSIMDRIETIGSPSFLDWKKIYYNDFAWNDFFKHADE